MGKITIAIVPKIKPAMAGAGAFWERINPAPTRLNKLIHAPRINPSKPYRTNPTLNADPGPMRFTTAIIHLRKEIVRMLTERAQQRLLFSCLLTRFAARLLKFLLIYGSF